MNTKTKKSFWKDNGLSIVLLSLFAAFLAGHAISGWFHHNEEQQQHGELPLSFSEYLVSGSFGESVFENWESEFLQMALYVILTAYLFQRGSAESKDPDSKEEVDEDPREHQGKSDAPLPVRKGGVLLTLYNYSLFIAFALFFLLSFVGHLFTGVKAFNEEAESHGQATITALQYLGSSQLWYESFQNWQSEFLAIFAIVVLSIWLRQKGSPESKPVAASHSTTGA